MYQAGLPQRSNQERSLRSKAGRPPSVIDTSNNPTQQNEIDSITAATGIDTSEFYSVQTTPDEPIRPRRIQRKKAVQKKAVQKKAVQTKATRRSTRKRNISPPIRKSKRSRNLKVTTL